jgi:hypothetical protein
VQDERELWYQAEAAAISLALRENVSVSIRFGVRLDYFDL